MRLFVESYCVLIWTAMAMRRHSLQVLLAKVSPPLRPTAGDQPTSLARRISRALDLACVFYPRRVFCLQRSLAAILLLRRYGIAAELVLGARILPFKSHAWVEVGGVPVNDKPYMREIYQVFDAPEELG